MLAGAFKVDITPPIGVELSGFVVREQPSIGMLDPLCLRALYLEHDGHRLLWLHADLIGCDRGLVDRIKKAVGFAPDEVMVTATHTHSGPPTMPLLGCGTLHDDAYLDLLVQKAVEAGRKAQEQVVPVRVVSGSASCASVLDRRHNRLECCPVTLIGFEGSNGTVAAIVHAPVHSVALGPLNRRISGDIHGMAADMAEKWITGSPVVLVVNGACGDLNPPTEDPDPAKCEKYAGYVAIAAVLALESSNEEPDLLSTGDLSQCLEVDSYAESLPFVSKLRRSVEDNDEPWAKRIVGVADDWTRTNALQDRAAVVLPIQRVQIGRWKLIGVGAEPLSAMQKAVETRTLIVGYANGCVGYLAPSEAYDEGGYEVDSAFVYYGGPRIARGGFEKVVESLMARSSETSLN